MAAQGKQKWVVLLGRARLGIHSQQEDASPQPLAVDELVSILDRLGWDYKEKDAVANIVLELLHCSEKQAGRRRVPHAAACPGPPGACDPPAERLRDRGEHDLVPPCVEPLHGLTSHPVLVAPVKGVHPEIRVRGRRARRYPMSTARGCATMTAARFFPWVRTIRRYWAPR